MALDWGEIQNWNEYSKAFIGLFARLSPPLIIPLFLNAVGDRPWPEKVRVSLAATGAFAALMLFFNFYGLALLDLFGITMAAFRIAGGFLLFLLAVKMIQSEEEPEPLAGAVAAEKGKLAREHWLALGIVPIGTPILAGPGALTTMVIFSEDHAGLEHKLLLTGVLLVITLYVGAALLLASAAKSLIGPLVTKVFNRIMGLIMLAIAVEFMLDGFAAHFPKLMTEH